MLPVAVDALGGDKAPAEIIDGAKQAAALGIPVLLVGPADLGTRFDIGNLPLHVATEFIDMHEDPASSVRTKKAYKR
jgi:glycerol-3-phosphate acyltransferase PlsX